MALIGVKRALIRPKLIVAAGGGGGSLNPFVWKSVAFITGTPSGPVTTWNGGATTFAIGTASSDRIVVACIAWKGSGTTNQDISSVIVGGITLTQAAYLRGTTRGAAIYWGLIPSGTTATLSVGGWVAGWVDDVVVNLGTLTGSAAASVASNIISAPPGYPNGSTGQSVTVPASGCTVIAGITDDNGFVPTVSFTGATVDNTQDSGATSVGTAAHLTASGTVTMSTNNGGTWGWVASNFQP